MVEDSELDVVVAALLCGLALNEGVLRRLAERGHDQLRFSHGFVVQHLIERPLRVGELAMRLGVSQQAASKAARELEALGYAERFPDAADGRVRMVRLTGRGEQAVADACAARQEIAGELASSLGPRRVANLRRLLLDTLKASGGMEAVRARRVPQVR